MVGAHYQKVKDFYPRPPRGGRLHLLRPATRSTGHFYPRPPRGGRLCGRLCADLEDLISIHALREEGDVAAVRIGGEATLFLSTPSARRATPQQQTLRGESNISIHALREEGDNSKQARRAAISISIHALREEGDDKAANKYADKQIISIHALREEGDSSSRVMTFIIFEFLSTPSARRATQPADQREHQ